MLGLPDKGRASKSWISATHIMWLGSMKGMDES